MEGTRDRRGHAGIEIQPIPRRAPFLTQFLASKASNARASSSPEDQRGAAWFDKRLMPGHIEQHEAHKEKKCQGTTNMRKVDGWKTLATTPIDQQCDLAA
jgi:hypothetical protein